MRTDPTPSRLLRCCISAPAPGRPLLDSEVRRVETNKAANAGVLHPGAYGAALLGKVHRRRDDRGKPIIVAMDDNLVELFVSPGTGVLLTKIVKDE